MKFYDFYVEVNEPEIMEKLGFSGFCYVKEFENINEYKKEKNEIAGLCGVKIKVNTVKELEKKVNMFRDANFIILDKTNEKVAEIAVKKCLVDAILDHARYPLIKKMTERNIAQVINFSEILNSKGEERSKVIAKTKITLKQAKKYKTPLIIVSGAKNKNELKAASILISFLRILGYDGKESKKCLYEFQEKIIEREKLKKEGKWIAPGVRWV